MCLIDNNRKTLVFQPCNAVRDIREFLNRGCNDFSIAVQSNRKVSGVAFIVHHTDKSSFVLHAHNSPLELTINHNTIGHDHNIVKNNLIICIVQSDGAPAMRWSWFCRSLHCAESDNSALCRCHGHHPAACESHRADDTEGI